MAAFCILERTGIVDPSPGGVFHNTSSEVTEADPAARRMACAADHAAP